ncbi:glycosyltransferase [Kitasatospora griseola]
MTDPRPRIALVLQGQAHQGGGVATSVLRLARGLDRDGRFAVDVVALCPALPAPPGADPVPVEPVETDGGVHFYELRPGAALPTGTECELAVQQALVKLARRRRYALLHGFYACTAGYQAAWAAAECGVPLVVGIRGNDIYRDVFGSKALPRLQWALDRATRIIAVSSEAARRADILTGCGPRTTVVLNSITTDHYREGAVRTPGAPVIGTLGKLRSKKGVDLLVRAFPTVLEQHPDARLLLAGEITEDAAALPDLVTSLGIADRTTFTGAVPREDALRHLRGMDVFVLPSLHDGCPNAVLEAMAAGTPVVANAVGAVPEMLEDGKEAVLVQEPGSWRAVAAGILTMLAADRSSIAERARQALHTRFDLAREIEENTAVYRACLGRADVVTA